MTELPATELATFKARLLERKALLEALSESAKEGRAAVELDQTRVGRLSRMDAMQMQQMALASERQREAELSRINTALGRMDSDDYGYCINCDEPIAAKRLEVDPSVLSCIRCAGGKGE